MLGHIEVVAAALIMAAAPVRAETPSAGGDLHPTLSLTVSGGVSLGAYKAGFGF